MNLHVHTTYLPTRIILRNIQLGIWLVHTNKSTNQSRFEQPHFVPFSLSPKLKN